LPEEKQPSTSIAALTYKPALERVRAVPGVEEAALMSALPLSGVNLGSSFTVAGRPKDPAGAPNARVAAVSGRYERVMNTPVIRGRMINEDDSASAPFVVVINERLQKEFFPNEDPIGKQLDFDGKNTGLTKQATIVGVFGNQVDNNISEAPRPLLLFSFQQVPTTSLYYAALIKTVVFYVVKTRGNVAVASEMRNVFHQVAPDMAVDNFQALQKTVDDSTFNSRLGLYLTGAFAGMAVLMVVAGLYGVLAQVVSYRRREIGLRMALGATPARILTMVVRQGSVMVVTGLIIGLAAAVFVTKLLKDFLYRVNAVDPWTYVGVGVLLLVIGSVAALVPARRAAAVQPMQALREE
jgi:putative ABC transport system permease protein